MLQSPTVEMEILGVPMKFVRLLAIFAVVTVVMATLIPASHAQDPQTPDELCESAAQGIEEPETRTFSEPEEVLEQDVDYKAIFCTEDGAVYVDLLEDFVPVTVNNFVFLAQNDYYNNTTFHRVIADFMVQGGDPTGTGSGGPGYQFEDEFVPFLSFNTPGWLAMANAGPGTNGSQFFITRVPTPHLNGRHTIFGRVLEGQTVVDEMRNRDPQNPDDAASPGVTLQTVLIVEDDSDIATDYEPPETFTAEEIVDTIRSIPIDGFSITESDVEESDDATVSFVSWERDECPEAPDLLAVGLQFRSYETAADAEAVMEDTSGLAEDFEILDDASTAVDGDVYFQPTEACDTNAEAYRYVWNRGSYVLVMNYTVGEGIVTEENRAGLATRLSTAFEEFMGEVILNDAMQ
jgi:cyclophilin family peptidyl-prolyl cis-trans isomerase